MFGWICDPNIYVMNYRVLKGFESKHALAFGRVKKPSHCTVALTGILEYFTSISYISMYSIFFYRYMIATRDIEPLELILKEDPAVVGPYSKSGSGCLHCLKKVDGSYLCSGCQFPMCDLGMYVVSCLTRECSPGILGSMYISSFFQIVNPIFFIKTSVDSSKTKITR